MAEDSIDKIMDELINKAIPEYINNSKDKLEDEIEHVFSDRHNKMMNDLFEHVAQKERTNKLKRLSKIVAICMICSVSLGLMLLPNSCAIKKKFEGLFLKDRKWYSILVNSNEDLKVNIWQYDGKEVDISPFTYLPLGYNIVCFKEDIFHKRIDLSNGQEYIKVRLIKTHKDKVDTEDADEAIYLSINKIPVIYYEKEGESNFMYNYKDYTISIYGNAEYKTLTKIIEKME